MDILQGIFGYIRPTLPLALALFLGITGLAAIRRFLERKYEGQSDKKMKLQLIMLLLSFVLVIIAVIVSPLNATQQGQILSLIGIVLSATIALSSTTFVGNAMAGLMLRALKNFRVGDFIRVGDDFGRVSERGLFHVEIQTEARDLTTLPNLHLVTQPVRVVRYSGTIVWTEISLGYNVPRTRVRDVLLHAAEQAELQDPYVHVINLGDFAVVYRVSGLLAEVKQLLTTRSRLRECVMDALHAAQIEIVSPTFMNTRSLSTDDQFIPEIMTVPEPAGDEEVPEVIVFDKAEEAESLEQLRQRITETGEQIKDLEKSLKQADDDRTRSGLEAKIARLRNVGEYLSKRLERALQENDRDPK